MDGLSLYTRNVAATRQDSHGDIIGIGAYSHFTDFEPSPKRRMESPDGTWSTERIRCRAIQHRAGVKASREW